MRDPLQGAKVLLSPLRDEDLGTIAAWRQDGEFLRLFDAAPAYPGVPAELVDLIAAGVRGQAFPFALRALSDRRMIGFASLDGILWSQGNSWLTLAIGRPEDRRQGFGRDAMDILLRFAFDELNLRRISLTVFSYNVAAITLYERLGFAREGSYREFVRRDGGLHDMYLYGLLRREWTAVEQR